MRRALVIGTPALGALSQRSLGARGVWTGKESTLGTPLPPGCCRWAAAAGCRWRSMDHVVRTCLVWRQATGFVAARHGSCGGQAPELEGASVLEVWSWS